MLDMDKLLIQTRIEAAQDKITFFNCREGDIDWILHEGHMVKSFLHLEDQKPDHSLKKL